MPRRPRTEPLPRPSGPLSRALFAPNEDNDQPRRKFLAPTRLRRQSFAVVRALAEGFGFVYRERGVFAMEDASKETVVSEEGGGLPWASASLAGLMRPRFRPPIPLKVSPAGACHAAAVGFKPRRLVDNLKRHAIVRTSCLNGAQREPS